MSTFEDRGERKDDGAALYLRIVSAPMIVCFPINDHPDWWSYVVLPQPAHDDPT